MALCCVVLFGVGGCKSILDGDMSSVTLHQDQAVTATDSVIKASNYEELVADMLGFVTKHEETGQINVYDYTGDVQQDVDRACAQIMKDTPLGSYAVQNMTGFATKIVSYYDVVIDITYKKAITKEQIENISSPVSTLRYLKIDLENTLTEYEPSVVILTNGITLTEADALSYVKQIYYENPIDIVMLPITTADFFPDHGPDRIIEFNFVYRYESSSILKVMEKTLKSAVQNIVESVSGDDGNILLSFCQHLIDTVEYDTATADSGEYSRQNTAATAYGALINGSAIGEGYAMGYKALCDELVIECYVVLGEKDGTPHAWNIVALDNYYYHIDVSMCDVNGIATAFLKNDTEMAKTYTWDKTKYKSCNGPLSYEFLTAQTLPSASST